MPDGFHINLESQMLGASGKTSLPVLLPVLLLITAGQALEAAAKHGERL